MAYATVPQGDGAGMQRDLDSPPSLPAMAHTSNTSLSAAFEDLAGALFVDHPAQDARSKVADVLKSLTSSVRSRPSYELVEEEDYEQPLATPKLPREMSAMLDQSSQNPADQDQDQALPARTASISRHLPLNHPAPDLQSLQGAYLKNVERLEDSAARLSMGSSLEEELYKMKQEIRRTESRRRTSNASATQSRQYSATSISNSIIAVNAAARSGGYSPAAFVTSPVGSVKSTHRRPSQRESRISRTSHPSNLIASLPEPEMEGRPLDSDMVHSPPIHAAPFTAGGETTSSQDEPERPSTAASGDTYRQAQHLFTDFDGTHFSPDEGFMSRRISLVQPPLARDSKAYKEPQPGEKMIYYPAPVPVMLNLPKRLSRMDFGERDKRRLKALSGIPDEMRKSMAFPPTEEVEPASPERTRRNSRPMSNIPPQLRASAFFDHMPGVSPEVKLKDGSAVATLDDILNAAAHAPVSAFTDHPIAGHLGAEVYGQEARKSKLMTSEETKRKRKSSVTNLLDKRKSSNRMSRRMSQPLDEEVPTADDDPERVAERSLAPGDDELTDGMNVEDEVEDEERASQEDEDEHERSEDEQSHQLGFLGAPTTLLAELQMRKAQQKSRNRTAANAFPNGMHSTLLELDAVAQLQQKSRKQKHVALAWEDQEAVSRENYDDDDVPLGVLFPEKEEQNRINHNRPLGLMEKRELEENEPLSSRRARLRGEPYQPPMHPTQELSPRPQEPTPAIQLSGVDKDEDEDDEEEEGESLAQRAKRMKEKKENGAGLANDIAGELGLKPEDLGGSTPSPAPAEETLGQRRKRLQEEALRPGIKKKTSLADLLQANPVGNRNPSRVISNESRLPQHQQQQQVSPFAQQPTVAPPPYYPQQPLLGHNFQANGIPNMYGSAPNPYAGYAMPQMQMPGMQGFQNTNLGFNYGMNMSMSHGAGQMAFPMSQPAGFDAIGMGPPLNPQQRANIDRWRQGIA